MSGARTNRPTGRSTRLGAAAAAGILVLTLFGQLVPVNASLRTKADFVCPEGRTVAASGLPTTVNTRQCDLVGKVLSEGSVSVVIPAPGHGVSVSALGPAGETSLYVFNSPEGVLSVFDSGVGATESFSSGPTEPPPCDEIGATGCIEACSDTTYHLNPYKAKEKNGQPWYFKASSTPTGGTPALTADIALAQIKAGTKTIVTGRNDCLLGDPVPQGAPYKGTTAKGSGISSTSRCPAFPGNGKSIVDFGNLAGQAGLACTAYTKIGNGPWFISEADIRFEKDMPWTTTPDADDCSGLLDLQSVAAHERGHAFGLKHAAEAGEGDAHLPQTMFWSTYPCSSYARTLGKGDHAGLKALY